jgi:hypothetical protein
MFGLSNLKSTISVNEETVECPAKGCKHLVPRQRRVFRKLEVFKCPKHGIFISPSTFQYENRLENILWTNPEDQNLLFNGIFSVKRETERIARDNSEDAVTWNVFRYLEKQNLIAGYLSNLVGYKVEDCEAIYWSYCQKQSNKHCWYPLQQVREEFELNPAKGSEPDLIIKTKDTLFFIEAKLNASNNTTPSSTDPAVKRKYETGCECWYSQVFQSPFEKIAVADRKYELLRFWLLGSKIADRLHVKFYLVNLVPQEKETPIEPMFGKHIKENTERLFLRTTWEDIYRHIRKAGIACEDKETLLRYFSEKTVGYNQDRNLQRAFNID